MNVFEAGLTNEALRYGRHTVFRDEAIPVRHLLEQALVEGRPLKLRWPGQDITGPVRDEPQAETMVLPAIPADDEPDQAADFAGSDGDAEPSANRREALRWLGPDGFTWFPSALAG